MVVVARPRGGDRRLHARDVLILLAWGGVSHYLQHHHLADAGAGIVCILALFAIVVLHELGHALTARHYAFAPATSRSCQSVARRA